MQNFHDQLAVIPEVYESAILEDNLEHSGGLTVSWNASENVIIPLGAKIQYKNTYYILLEPYAPSRVTDGLFRYEVTFRHPINILDRIPFWVKTMNAQQEVIIQRTVSFTGSPNVIANKLAAFFSEYATETGDTYFSTVVGTGWGASLNGVTTSSAVITVTFDGCSIKEAANAIANALECNVFFDWNTHVIRFISGTTLSGEVYNCFHVLGGTSNMGKTTASGSYAAITQRLTLPYNSEDPTAAGSYPGSIISSARPGDIRLTRDLIFDDIYPKMELYVMSVRPRYCFLTDEDGNKIVDHYEYPIGTTVSPGTEGAIPFYKTYAKYYVRLGTRNSGSQQYTEYNFDVSNMIDDKPLTLLFQPSLEGETTSPLAGRSFELAYYSVNTPEWGEDDYLPRTSPWTAQAKEYRLEVQAEGEILLPASGRLVYPTGDSYSLYPADSIPSGTVCPQVGNKVTLVNVMLGEAEINRAKQQLLAAATEIIGMMDTRLPEQTRTLVNKKNEEIPVVGTNITSGEFNGYIVARIRRDADTDVTEVTYGSWNSRKSLTGRVSDKIDQTTVGSFDATGITSQNITQAQLEALMKTTKKSSAMERIAILGTEVDGIKEQTDQQFSVWFGEGEPTADSLPASAWTTTALKDEHLQDIYYDTSKEASSTGGRAWRWVLDDGTYKWEIITDLDTLASLEKIAYITSDTILTAGSEKTRVYNDWKDVLAEMDKNTDVASDYTISENVKYTTLYGCFCHLADVLNGGVDDDESVMDDIYDGTVMPAWIDDLTEDTDMDDYSLDDLLDIHEVEDFEGTWADYYRKVWNDYRAAAEDFMAYVSSLQKTAAANAKAQADAAMGKVEEIGADGKLSPAEKIIVKREFLSSWNEKDGAGGILDKCYYNGTAIISESTYITPYKNAFVALGTYLNGGTSWNSGSQRQSDDFRSIDSNLPLWIQNNNISTTNTITSTAWRAVCSNFYKARTAVLTALSEEARNRADAAQTTANSKMRVFVNEPVPPYNIGDLWYDGNLVYCCIDSKESGQFDAADWQETDRSLVTSLSQNLAHVAEAMEEYVSGCFADDSELQTIDVYFDSSEPSDASSGSVWYDTYSENVYCYNGSSWVTDENLDSDCVTALAAVEDNVDGYITFHRTLSDDARPMDIYFKKISFTDRFTNSTIEGGLDVWVKDFKSWQQMMEGTTAAIQNLGDAIVLAVAGSDAQSGVNYASGLVTQTNFATIFASAADAETGKASALAAIETLIEKDPNGNPTGVVNIVGRIVAANGTLKIGASSQSDESWGIQRKSGTTYINFSNGLELHDTFEEEFNQDEGTTDQRREGEIIVTKEDYEYYNSGASRELGGLQLYETKVRGDYVSAPGFRIKQYEIKTDLWEEDVVHTFTGIGSYFNRAIIQTPNGMSFRVVGGIVVEASGGGTQYLPLTGGTLTGNLTIGNVTIYSTGSNGGINSILIGDDAYIGDGNMAGGIGIKAKNSNVQAGIKFFTNEDKSCGELLARADMSLTYEGNLIWHAGNDGSGSGLDADTVDGYHANRLTTVYHMNVDPAIVPKWHRLGDYVTAGDNTNLIIELFSGDGYNGSASQNSFARIVIKDGFQNTQQSLNSVGVTVERFGNIGDIQVAIDATAHDAGSVWVYLPWAYAHGTYVVFGEYNSWTNNGSSSTDTQTEPTHNQREVQYFDCLYRTNSGESLSFRATSGQTFTIAGLSVAPDSNVFGSGPIPSFFYLKKTIHFGSTSSITNPIFTFFGGKIVLVDGEGNAENKIWTVTDEGNEAVAWPAETLLVMKVLTKACQDALMAIGYYYDVDAGQTDSNERMSGDVTVFV